MTITWAELSSALVPFGIPQPEIDWRDSILTQWKELSRSVGEVRHDIRDIDYKFPALKEYNDQSAIYNAARIRKRLQSKHEALDLKVSEFEQLTHEKPWRTIDAALNKVLPATARSSCQALIKNMDHRLPRELRDMVYIQLLGDRALDPIIQYVKNQVDRDCCAHEPCPQFNLAHFLNLEFVSPEVITEMIQIAAESSSSRTPVHGLKNLERFLQIRAMHYNVPASRFTRRLVIYLNLQGLLKEYGLEHKSYFVENLQRLQDQLKSAFEAIPPRKDRRIDIQLDGYDLEEWELERGDILMKPCLSMLDERIARHEIAFVRVFRYNPNDPNGY